MLVWNEKKATDEQTLIEIAEYQSYKRLFLTNEDRLLTTDRSRFSKRWLLRILKQSCPAS
jgi:hypothetical protein